MLKLLHGMLHNDPESKKLLEQNRYLIIPTVNVDGLAYIEEMYEKTGKIEGKRKNMNVKTT